MGAYFCTLWNAIISPEFRGLRRVLYGQWAARIIMPLYFLFAIYWPFSSFENFNVLAHPGHGWQEPLVGLSTCALMLYMFPYPLMVARFFYSGTGKYDSTDDSAHDRPPPPVDTQVETY